MNLWRLAARGLWFHRRTNLAVVLGVAVAAAVLTGALAVGDSVRHSLHQMALARLGKIELALSPHERLFRAQLAADVGRELKATAAPLLLLPGTAAAGDGAQRANRVQVCGVDEQFWKLGGIGNPAESGVVLNERLAQQLRVKVGSEVVLRVEKPSFLGRDAPLSQDENTLAALRLPVSQILSDSTIGRFSLQSNQVPPYNAFVNLNELQKAVEQPGRANQILLGGRELSNLLEAGQALTKYFTLADTGAYWRDVPNQRVRELRTARVFLDPTIVQAAQPVQNARRVASYFTNAIEVKGRAIPYSIVAGVEGAPLPANMRADEVVLNAWAARDLNARVGDRVTLRYFVSGPGRKLLPRSENFRLRAIVPIAGAARDPDLMPDFPGIAGAENCRDWEPGVDVDLEKIRPQDEAYWDAHRGTPKAFVRLDTARELWRNRFGELTAIRFPSTLNAANVERAILCGATPSQLGLSFSPVRAQAMAASSQSLDFGGLFLALSFFLMGAALLLIALLFALGIENRAREIGTLLSLGFTPKRVRRMLLLEGTLLSLLGALPGAALGVLYAQVVLRALNSIWQGAVGTARLQFFIEPSSLAGGALGGVVMALLAIALVARKQAKTSARALLNGAASETNLAAPKAGRGAKVLVPLSVISLAAAGFLLVRSSSLPTHQQTGMFFGAGALLLMAGLAGSFALLSQTPQTQAVALPSLAARGLRRQRGRSLSVLGLLATASFLLAAIGAFRHDPLSDESLRRRDSGTGGFALWAESATPLYHDLNSAKGREKYSLEEVPASFVALRVREGDDASCLNLNRAQTPTLWGASPAALQQRRAFKVIKGQGWNTLSDIAPDGTIPAIGDENTMMWGLGKSLGDTLEYRDEAGQPFKVRLVGLVNKTILQGGLMVAEDHLVRLFPSSSGYRAFLIDVTPGQSTLKASEELTLALEDYGFEVMPTARRLALFQAVENTYLSVFQALGGLGLLLGCVGLGVVVLRNVLERRGELALLSAVGFRAVTLKKLIFLEHAILAIGGLSCGALAGGLAILPALKSSENTPFGMLLLTFGVVATSALLWTGMATWIALRAPLLESLRNE